MRNHVACAALLALLAGDALRADVTLRRTITITTGVGLPAQIQQQVTRQLAASVPPETVVRIKGDKTYATIGALIGITDYKTGQITLLNPSTRQFATGALADYLDGMASATQAITGALPADAQQMLQGMKFDVQTRKTGISQTIQGIAADESVITVAIGIPMPGSGTTQTILPTVRMEMHVWTVQPAAIARSAALKELAAYNARNKDAMDPTAALQKLFTQMPGLGDQLRKPIAQLTQANGGLLLRMRASIFIPALTLSFPQADPTKPMEELQSEVIEFSSAALDDSVFDVPSDYKPAPMQDLLKVLVPAPAQP